jgi:transcriptional regulator with XRE-family HTH domain
VIVASDFGKRLTDLREKAGMSQHALAKASKITAQAISLLERGESEPKWATVQKLARALGVSVAEFDTDDEGEPEKPAPKVKPKGK